MGWAKVTEEIKHFWDAKWGMCAASDRISRNLASKFIIFTCRWGTKSLTNFTVLVHPTWNAHILTRTSISRGCTRTFDLIILTIDDCG